MCVGETWSKDLVGSRHGAYDLRDMLRFTDSAPFRFLFKTILIFQTYLVPILFSESIFIQ